MLQVLSRVKRAWADFVWNLAVERGRRRSKKQGGGRPADDWLSWYATKLRYGKSRSSDQ